MNQEKIEFKKDWDEYLENFNYVDISELEATFWKISMFVHIPNLFGAIMIECLPEEYNLSQTPKPEHIQTLFDDVIKIEYTTLHLDSIEYFFTRNDDSMTRHIAAHDILTAKKRTSSLLIPDIIKHAQRISDIIDRIIIKYSNESI